MQLIGIFSTAKEKEVPPKHANSNETESMKIQDVHFIFSVKFDKQKEAPKHANKNCNELLQTCAFTNCGGIDPLPSEKLTPQQTQQIIQQTSGYTFYTHTPFIQNTFSLSFFLF